MYGYLHKLSHGKIKKKRWHQARYFEVTPNQLRYYDKPFPRTSDKIKGALELEQTKSCEPEESDAAHFLLVMQDGFEMHLRAWTAEISRQWVDAIKSEWEKAVGAAEPKQRSMSLAVSLDMYKAKQVVKRHTSLQQETEVNVEGGEGGAGGEGGGGEEDGKEAMEIRTTILESNDEDGNRVVTSSDRLQQAVWEEPMQSERTNAKSKLLIESARGQRKEGVCRGGEQGAGRWRP
jgi:hypothetical protein